MNDFKVNIFDMCDSMHACNVFGGQKCAVKMWACVAMSVKATQNTFKTFLLSEAQP
jgi:hypothetical protein